MNNLPVLESRASSSLPHAYGVHKPFVGSQRGNVDPAVVKLISRLKTATLIRVLTATIYFVSVQLTLSTASPDHYLLGLGAEVKWLTLGVYAYSLILLVSYYFFRGPRSAKLQTVIHAQTVIDVVIVSVYAALTGFSGSFFTVFYFILIFFSASAAPRRWFAVTIIMTVAAYAGLAIVELLLLPTQGLFAKSLVPLSRKGLYSNVMINLSAFVGVSVLSNYYSRFVMRLEDERVDYLKLRQIHEHLVDVMPLGLIVADLKRNITLLNHYAERLLRISEPQVIGVAITKYFRGLKPILDNEEKLERGVNEVTHEIVGKEKRRLRWNISALADERQRRIGYLIVFEDVSDVYKLEKRTKKMEELAIIGRLAAGVVHEIRNPLASISGSVQVLSELATLPDDERNLTHIILREVDHLSQWTDEFLSYARPKEPECHDVDLVALLDDVVVFFRLDRETARDERITVETRFDVGVRAWLDPHQIRRAVRNVLNNARDALRDHAVHEGRIVVELQRTVHHVSIRIIDNGPGMSVEMLDHLFEPFYTTKEGGTGLGLSIVQRILEGHGGLVRVQSRMGEGSVVEFALPTSASPVATGTFESIVEVR
jgi:two-component system, NtrC family, sensor histidine kinase PilS